MCRNLKISAFRLKGKRESQFLRNTRKEKKVRMKIRKMKLVIYIESLHFLEQQVPFLKMILRSRNNSQTLRAKVVTHLFSRIMRSYRTLK